VKTADELKHVFFHLTNVLSGRTSNDFSRTNSFYVMKI
jgi:hypothetical protein